MEHHNTSKQDRILGALDYLQSKKIPHSKNDVFKHFNVGKSSGYKILREAQQLENPADQRNFHQTHIETRGRKRILTPSRLAAIERLIETDSFNAHTIPWAAMPAAAGLNVELSGETIRRAIKTIKFRSCIVCEKQWVSPKLASTRQEYCRRSLEARPRSEDWRTFRFTDEVHFSYGPQGKIWVCRRPWERACGNCLVEKELLQQELDPKQKRLCAWAAVGYNGFRDGLYWYDVPGNLNGKISQQFYHDMILEPIVGEWVRRGDNFILEEDNISGYSGKGKNVVTMWKADHNIVNVFNCPQSPDLVASPIEKALQGPKEFIRRQPSWDVATLKTAAQEGFNALTTASVNRWIDEIPDILKACIENEGYITAQ